jgi:hypothetical protein
MLNPTKNLAIVTMMAAALFAVTIITAVSIMPSADARPNPEACTHTGPTVNQKNTNPFCNFPSSEAPITDCHAFDSNPQTGACRNNQALH